MASPNFAPGVGPQFRQRILKIFAGLPPLVGNPICFECRSCLTVYRKQLLADAELGIPVHAAAFIRKRVVILETALFSQPRCLRLILLHEIFHFVWVRLNNGQRRAFADLLIDEMRSGARGEIGESASVKKQLLQKQGQLDKASYRWRDYVCESFCDSAAAFYSGASDHQHNTLAARWVKRRYEWLLRHGDEGWKC